MESITTSIRFIENTGEGSIELPNAAFIADARFTQEGDALVLNDAASGQTLIVKDYFAGESPLLIAEGMQATPALIATFLETPQAHSAGANTQEAFGTITDLAGTAWVIRNGVREELTAESTILKGDIVETSEDGALEMLFADGTDSSGTQFSLGGDARFAIDSTIAESGAQSLSLLKGAFAFISGESLESDLSDTIISTPLAEISLNGGKTVGEIVPGGESSFTVIEGHALLSNKAGSIGLDQDFATAIITSALHAPTDAGVLTPDQAVARYVAIFEGGTSSFADFISQDVAGAVTAEESALIAAIEAEQGAESQFSFAEQLRALDALSNIEQVETASVIADFAALDTTPLEVASTTASALPIAASFSGTDAADDFAGTTGDLADTVSYANSDAGVTIDLAAAALAAGDPTMTYTATGGYAEGDSYTSIENIDGSCFEDMLTGDGSANTLRGGAAADTLEGGVGADVLDGGAGSDTASYASSNEGVQIDLVLSDTTNLPSVSGGHAAGDILTNIENLLGSAHDDVLAGDANANTFTGGAGNDILSGGAGIDTLNGGAGADELQGGADADVLDGGAGVDMVSYFDSNAAVTVNLLDSTASGGHAAGDTLSNFEGIEGSNYADTLTGDAGDNILFGGDGADTIDGGAGEDTVVYTGTTYASDGTSTTSGVTVSLVASASNTGGDAQGDVLSNVENIIGSAQADSLTGNTGANVLEGGGGVDTLTGGTGADSFVFGAGSGADTITDLNMGDKLVFLGTSETTQPSLTGITITSGAGTAGTITTAMAGDTVTLQVGGSTIASFTSTVTSDTDFDGDDFNDIIITIGDITA